MALTAIEQSILGIKGNYSSEMKRLFGVDISENNAKKQITGMKRLIDKVMQSEGKETTQKTVSFNPDKTQTVKQDIYLTEGEAASPTLIMIKCGFDPLLWEVVSCKVVNGSWDVTIKNADGEGELHTNRKYSVTLTVKPLANNLTMPQVIEAFKALPPVKVRAYERRKGNGMLELPIMDFHLAKMAWGRETGQGDYDLEIAEKLWKGTINELLSKAVQICTPEYILFPIGQDFFHFDSSKTTTTSGTQLDSDTRWQKMFTKGAALLVWAIEQCRAIAPVKVIWVSGNHDMVLSYAATVGLYQRYFATDDVDVDLSPTKRKYHCYGKNLIGYAHGENEGKRIEGLMQIEAPDDWGNTIWREFHLGHLHNESSYTKGGIVFRRISSITAADAWHAEMGFLGATRQAQAFIWDKNKGLQMIINSNVII